MTTRRSFLGALLGLPAVAVGAASAAANRTVTIKADRFVAVGDESALVNALRPVAEARISQIVEDNLSIRTRLDELIEHRYDLANSKFPRQVYDATRFSGLLP